MMMWARLLLLPLYLQMLVVDAIIPRREQQAKGVYEELCENVELISLPHEMYYPVHGSGPKGKDKRTLPLCHEDSGSFEWETSGIWFNLDGFEIYPQRGVWFYVQLWKEGVDVTLLMAGSCTDECFTIVSDINFIPPNQGYQIDIPILGPSIIHAIFVFEVTGLSLFISKDDGLWPSTTTTRPTSSPSIGTIRPTQSPSKLTIRPTQTPSSSPVAAPTNDTSASVLFTENAAMSSGKGLNVAGRASVIVVGALLLVVGGVAAMMLLTRRRVKRDAEDTASEDLQDDEAQGQSAGLPQDRQQDTSEPSANIEVGLDGINEPAVVFHENRPKNRRGPDILSTIFEGSMEDNSRLSTITSISL